MINYISADYLLKIDDIKYHIQNRKKQEIKCYHQIALEGKR